MKVYLDNAATTRVDSEVVATMQPYFTEDFGNASSIHSWGQRARVAVDEARQKVARALNAAKTQEIIFISCATEANNLALRGVVEYARATDPRLKDGRLPHLIVSPIEHHCVYDTAKYLEKTKQAEVSWLKVDSFGLVDPNEIENLIKPETILVSVMFINNEVGTIEPLAEIGQIIRARHGNKVEYPYFHTDAVQAIEYLDVDVQELGIDLLSLSGHKFHAPKGIGALYIRDGVKLTPQILGGGQEYRQRAGTENVPYIVGIGKAIEIAVKDREQTRERVQKLRGKLINGTLQTIPNARLTGHREKRAPHIASFVFPGAEGEAIILMLDRAGIASSSGSACTSGNLEPSHVLLAMGISKEAAHTSLRLSLSKETTEAEIDYVLAELPKVIEHLRKMAPQQHERGSDPKIGDTDDCFKLV